MELVVWEMRFRAFPTQLTREGVDQAPGAWSTPDIRQASQARASERDGKQTSSKNNYSFAINSPL